MGLIIGRFRKSKDTYEVLEKLENEITSIEEFRRSTEQRKNKIIGRFILLAVFSYLLLAIGLYFYYTKISPNRMLVYIVLLIALPIVIYFVKNFLAWYYSRKLGENEQKLGKLKEQKKKILDNVMETETYKVAKRILDKFGSEPKRILISDLTSGKQKTTAILPSTVRPIQPDLRQRVGITKSRLSFGSSELSSSPYPNRALAPAASPLVMSRPSTTGLMGTPQLGPVAQTSTPSQLPRSILPKDRSILDKMVDYLVGDGPSNRYALVCKKCFGHNGMALQEEFEYFAFKCCYCSHFNPARKKRFSAPTFDSKSGLSQTITADSSDSDVSTLDSDADSVKPLITEPRSNSPDTEKNSDFDRLSDADFKEIESVTAPKGEVTQESSNDLEQLLTHSREVDDSALVEETEVLAPSPMEIDEPVKKSEDTDMINPIVEHSEYDPRKNPFENE